MFLVRYNTSQEVAACVLHSSTTMAGCSKQACVLQMEHSELGREMNDLHHAAAAKEQASGSVLMHTHTHAVADLFKGDEVRVQFITAGDCCLATGVM
jgi:hypothetical protein